MTEGIIQEVFKPYLMSLYHLQQECRNEDPGSQYTKDATETLTMTLKIQNELIAKIKNALDIDKFVELTATNLDAVTYRLIGDNQE